MEFNEYQEKAHATAQYPNIAVVLGHDNLQYVDYLYAALGLVGEAGEVAEKIKKIVRNKNGVISTEDEVQIEKELGDCLWYISELAYCFDLVLSDVAEANLKKLEDRIERGVIKSEGDNR